MNFLSLNAFFGFQFLASLTRTFDEKIKIEMKNEKFQCYRKFASSPPEFPWKSKIHRNFHNSLKMSTFCGNFHVVSRPKCKSHSKIYSSPLTSIPVGNTHRFKVRCYGEIKGASSWQEEISDGWCIANECNCGRSEPRGSRFEFFLEPFE